MNEARRQLLFDQLKDLCESTKVELKEAFMGKEVTLVNTFPKVSRGRAALIDGIIFNWDDGEPLFLCMVLRSGAKEGERDFLNSATWTRSYRPWSDFILMDELLEGPPSCPACLGRTFAAVDENAPGGGFRPGPNRRCVSCKRVYAPAPRDRWLLVKED